MTAEPPTPTHRNTHPQRLRQDYTGDTATALRSGIAADQLATALASEAQGLVTLVEVRAPPAVAATAAAADGAAAATAAAQAPGAADEAVGMLRLSQALVGFDKAVKLLQPLAGHATAAASPATAAAGAVVAAGASRGTPAAEQLGKTQLQFGLLLCRLLQVGGGGRVVLSSGAMHRAYAPSPPLPLWMLVQGMDGSLCASPKPAGCVLTAAAPHCVDNHTNNCSARMHGCTRGMDG